VLSSAINDRATNDGTVPKVTLSSFKVPSCVTVPSSATYTGVINDGIVCKVPSSPFKVPSCTKVASSATYDGAINDGTVPKVPSSTFKVHCVPRCNRCIFTSLYKSLEDPNCKSNQ
jgi:hypothetical protein